MTAVLSSVAKVACVLLHRFAQHQADVLVAWPSGLFLASLLKDRTLWGFPVLQVFP